MISLVVAMGQNRVIGANNQMPWHLSADLRRFRAITMGKPIIMGRRTHESIGRPLPGRDNIVLTTDPAFYAPECILVRSLDEALEKAGDRDAMVIGGSTLYAAFLPMASRIYLTEIHSYFAGDTFFPEFDRKAWQEVSREEQPTDDQSGLRFSFIILERSSPFGVTTGNPG